MPTVTIFPALKAGLKGAGGNENNTTRIASRRAAGHSKARAPAIFSAAPLGRKDVTVALPRHNTFRTAMFRTQWLFFLPAAVATGGSIKDRLVPMRHGFTKAESSHII